MHHPINQSLLRTFPLHVPLSNTPFLSFPRYVTRETKQPGAFGVLLLPDKVCKENSEGRNTRGNLEHLYQAMPGVYICLELSMRLQKIFRYFAIWAVGFLSGNSYSTGWVAHFLMFLLGISHTQAWDIPVLLWPRVNWGSN